LKFISFLKNNFLFLSIKHLADLFDNVSQSLVFISLKYNPNSSLQEEMIVDDKKTSLEDCLSSNEDNLISFKDIFKKTYLGSVPCESILLSIEGEPLLSFKNRMVKLFSANDYSDNNLINLLSYNGVPHLRVLKSDDLNSIAPKLEIIRGYIANIKNNVDINIFNDSSSYKEIQHRKSIRFYFRNQNLKKCGFVYELNPNPCNSFYFTGNPSASSTDYFGYCSYDVNRNSSPGACRTIPISNLEDNILDSFKKYWNENTNNLPYEKIFEYIIHISKSTWYKEIKREKKRLYFSIPKDFDKSFLS
jgi:hypothetical protein